MVPWWTMLIPAGIALFFWFLWTRTANQRDEAVSAVHLVELEYRLMSQNCAIFDKVQDNHEEMKSILETLQREHQ